MDFEKITDEQKDALHITSVSDDHLDFRKGDFGTMLELFKYKDGDFGIEIDDNQSRYILTKEQMQFIGKWIAND